MGGADKAALEVGGTTLLERALAATAGATGVVVVGDRVPTSRSVAWTREQPPGGGPAAGLLAGLDALRAVHADNPDRVPTLVGVLAVDMPWVSAATFDRLVAALHGATDGALLVDEGGRRQLLCGVYRTDALLRARPATRAEEHGLPVRRLLGPLRLVEVRALPDEARDVDTWDDLRDLHGRH
jgi:molybdopterin-guanine dinucleotide biosynthesis protein A